MGNAALCGRPGQDRVVQLSVRAHVQEVVGRSTAVHRLTQAQTLGTPMDRLCYPESLGYRLGHVGATKRRETEFTTPTKSHRSRRDSCPAPSPLPPWSSGAFAHGSAFVREIPRHTHTGPGRDLDEAVDYFGPSGHPARRLRQERLGQYHAIRARAYAPLARITHRREVRPADAQTSDVPTLSIAGPYVICQTLFFYTPSHCPGSLGPDSVVDLLISYISDHAAPESSSGYSRLNPRRYLPRMGRKD
jgi:hypothetical protein